MASVSQQSGRDVWPSSRPPRQAPHTRYLPAPILVRVAAYMMSDRESLTPRRAKTNPTTNNTGSVTNAVTVRNAAEAAAARTGASGGRKSGWDLSGKDDTGVRPQQRKTRLSYLLAAENDGDNGTGVGGGGGGACSDLGAGEHQAGCPGGEGSGRVCANPAEVAKPS